MELKSTQIGQRLARHPYNRVRLLNAGIEVSGDKHQYLIPFNQLIGIQCKRGIVWGELEFELPEGKVVRLHGTEWQQTQRFYHYLLKEWQKWSLDMSDVSADVLAVQVNEIAKIKQQNRWLKAADLVSIQQQIKETFQALPLPLQRVTQFENCRKNYEICLDWLESGEKIIQTLNRQWVDHMLVEYGQFFQTIETSPLDRAQCQAVINGEQNILVLAGAGSGKTAVLIARAGWLLLRQSALPEQILLLAFDNWAADKMNERIQARLGTQEIKAKTFHALALHIIQQGSNQSPKISELEINLQKRRDFLVQEWQKQCGEKKAQAKGWREWLNEELGWQLPEGEYWHDKSLAIRLSVRLERWLELMRMQGSSQKEMLEQAPTAYIDAFQKRLRLMAPLLKAWKSALKSEEAVDFPGLIHQAVNILQKGRFISPWKHILVDEFQDISPLALRLLTALKAQNKQSHLFVAGDDWQAIYRFSGAELPLTTAFSTYFGKGVECTLDTTYRLNDRIGEIANQFVQQNPYQFKKPLNSLTKGSKKSVVILPEEQLEALLNKMSGYVTRQETILLLARYHYLKPELLKKAPTRWPNLKIEFMTIYAAKGQQADYVIILGLQQGQDGFPVPARESVIEQVLLPQPENFPDAEERRLLYVALTRAKKQVWLMQEPKKPSIFIHQLAHLGVPIQRKP
ncbi:DNA helicase IV [Xenorhabdus griffiniae]|uniref:DNA 3'-5' helicase n=1 Tax=Xenorhabdus griffiniae TaxID=351672 RepID=A0ABY9XDK8_9GAMM|nr:DNA helicase IV [Xenorhabdus griffiniae]MBD1227339.1 DNA helicase IV [Xenorhabdus griffiniae]MBE8589157.1 DNA helicase IV [Xenorhabdus griffiniae]WMV70999.1 DNA helicase IV [Xenorhabdus griffiniae]WNH00675.1 DNA helicase IV [Xenorhabdus griffiniae]